MGAAAVAVLCLVAAIGVLDWTNREASSRAEEGRRMQLDLDTFELGMVNQETGLDAYARTGRSEFLQPYDTGRQQQAGAQKALEADALDPGGRARLARLESTARSWQAFAEGTRARVGEDQPVEATRWEQGQQLFDAYRLADQSLDQYLDYRTRSAVRDATESSSLVALATPVLGALILLLILVLGTLVFRSILGPVGRLAAAALAVSRGDAASIPGRSRRDELGALANALQAWQEESAKRLGLAQAMVDVNSHLRLDEVLELGIRRAAEVLGAHEVCVLLAREGGFEITVGGARSPLDSISAWIERGPATQTVLNGRTTIGDYRDAVWGVPTRSWAAANGLGPVLAVPMVSQNVTVGALAATRLAGRPRFTEADAQVAQIIAGPLAAAVHVAHVFEEKEEQARTLAILNESGRAAGGLLDPVALAGVVVDKAVELLGGHHATLSWFEPADGLLHVVADNHPRPVGELAFGPGEGAAGVAFENAEPVVVEDYQAWASAQDWAARRGARSVVAVPLVANDMPVGALSVQTESVHRFSREDVERLSLLAGQVAPTIQAASLHAQLTRANEELTRVSNHKSRFLANMSHELRTPLNAILGFSELLLDEAPGKGAEKSQEKDQQSPEVRKRRSYLSHIHNSGKHLLGLINEVLDLAKIEAGQVELNQAPFHLAGAIAAAIETVEPLASQKRIAIVQEVDWAGTLFADEAKVRQILLNLLSNAVKFTPEGGKVTVGSRAENEMLFLSVTDNGPGIPLEDQRRIFDEFEQLESGRAVSNPGTGLGLALTRRLTELHAGRVWVESEPGRGSSFNVVLPLEPAGASEGETGEEEEEAPATEADLPPLVLVVEDNLAAATLLSSILRRAGYRPHVVRHGAQAVARVRELRPLAVTLDVLLPGLDGWEVLRQLKSDPETRDTPVVVVSVVDNRSLAIGLGADDYLVKPVDRQALLEAVGRHAGRARSGSRAPKVLVVEEEEDTLARLDAELQPSFSVLKARHGREGVELARKHRPDLVLLDLVGNEMAGFEVAAALKSDPRTRGIPVLGMTGGDLSESERARLNGWVDVIVAQGEDGTSHLLERLQTLQQRISRTSRTSPRNGSGASVPGQHKR